jgi:hypothetical protein
MSSVIVPVAVGNFWRRRRASKALTASWACRLSPAFQIFAMAFVAAGVRGLGERVQSIDDFVEPATLHSHFGTTSRSAPGGRVPAQSWLRISSINDDADESIS